MDLKKTIGLIIIVLITICTQAQTASVVFKGNSEFQVSINLIQQHNSFGRSIKVNNLEGNQPYNVKINFKNDTAFSQANIYLIDNGLTHIYSVYKEQIQLKKVIPAASYQKEQGQLVFNYIINKNLQIDTIIADTSTIDTSYKIPFASYYKLEDYEGRIGCPFPIKDVEQAKLRGVILAENLEESKFEKVKIAIEDMDSVCLLVDQIIELVSLFEFEETRLSFTKYISPNTFDIDNYEKLYPLFNFESNKDQIKELLK